MSGFGAKHIKHVRIVQLNEYFYWVIFFFHIIILIDSIYEFKFSNNPNIASIGQANMLDSDTFTLADNRDSCLQFLMTFTFECFVIIAMALFDKMRSGIKKLRFI